LYWDIPNLRIFIQNMIDSEILEGCRRSLLLLSFTHSFWLCLTRIYNCIIYVVLTILFSPKLRLHSPTYLPLYCLHAIYYNLIHIYTYTKSPRALWSDARLDTKNIRFSSLYGFIAIICKISSCFNIEMRMNSHRHTRIYL